VKGAGAGLILLSVLAARALCGPALAASAGPDRSGGAEHASIRAPIAPDVQRAAGRIVRGRDAGLVPSEVAVLGTLAREILHTRELLDRLVIRVELGGGHDEAAALGAHAARLRTLAGEARDAVAGRMAREQEIARARRRVLQLANELDALIHARDDQRAVWASDLLRRLRRDDTEGADVPSPEPPPMSLIWTSPESSQ
jgi:hypothetical protein